MPEIEEQEILAGFMENVHSLEINIELCSLQLIYHLNSINHSKYPFIITCYGDKTIIVGKDVENCILFRLENNCKTTGVVYPKISNENEQRF